MKKRWIILLTILLAVSLSLPSTASADEIRGTGTVWAKGAGVAILHGNGEIQIQGHGVGIVWVKKANTVEATGEGHRWDGSGDATVFWGWSGTIYASGDNMSVWMSGGLIEFTASGTGCVYLRGSGTYEVNGRQGFWSPTGQILTRERIQQAD